MNAIRVYDPDIFRRAALEKVASTGSNEYLVDLSMGEEMEKISWVKGLAMGAGKLVKGVKDYAKAIPQGTSSLLKNQADMARLQGRMLLDKTAPAVDTVRGGVRKVREGVGRTADRLGDGLTNVRRHYQAGAQGKTVDQIVDADKVKSIRRGSTRSKPAASSTSPKSSSDWKSPTPGPQAGNLKPQLSKRPMARTGNPVVQPTVQAGAKPGAPSTTSKRSGGSANAAPQVGNQKSQPVAQPVTPAAQVGNPTAQPQQPGPLGRHLGWGQPGLNQLPPDAGVLDRSKNWWAGRTPDQKRNNIVGALAGTGVVAGTTGTLLGNSLADKNKTTVVYR